MQKVCSAKALLCLTLSAYLVRQQLSLFQTARPYFTKCIKTKFEIKAKVEAQVEFELE